MAQQILAAMFLVDSLAGYKAIWNFSHCRVRTLRQLWLRTAMGAQHLQIGIAGCHFSNQFAGRHCRPRQR
jgi:NO-binding membrane sensor protein with MHYT domain